MARIEQAIHNPNSHLKTLIDVKNPKGKTELSDPQILAMNLGNLTGLVFDTPVVEFCIHDLQELQISRNRKSRGEYTDGVKSGTESIAEKTGRMASMFGR